MEYNLSIWSVLVLALLHYFGTRFHFLGGMPRSIWLSAAGGVAVAYVFLHLFPELDEGQEQVQQVVAELPVRHPVYLLALLGLAVFYGLERAVITSRKGKKGKNKDKESTDVVFWVHIGAFAFYNAFIGYMLFQRETDGVRELVVFSVAMAFHFIINDFALEEHHQETYKRLGRWILVAALVAGWTAGNLLQMPEHLLVLLVAFVGGGIVLNVLKEELPEERESRYWAFLLGTGLYTLLLLSL